MSGTRILVGDVRERLAEMPDESVHCVVTSPPYWGLRDYGTATWIGGDPDCDHRSPTMREGRNEDRAKLAGSAATNRDQLLLAHRSACGKCGAVKVDHQIGLEPTLGEHLAVMVEVFREVRRVLRKDGTLWLNYGDCYATAPNGRSAADTKAAGNDDRTFRDKPFSTVGGALKPKDLCMVPNRLAIALQEDGWWVRSEIIWSKPNPMPESIKDRPAQSHEKLFLLSRSPRYFFDAEAVREPATYEQPNAPDKIKSPYGQGFTRRARKLSTWEERKANGEGPRRGDPQQTGHTNTTDTLASAPGRNLRNVWEIATKPFPEAHFATFPPALVEPCIKAGCPEGGTVLDPFGGAGTTGLVANRLGRAAIIIELNAGYAEIARRRIEDDAPMFADVQVEGAIA